MRKIIKPTLFIIIFNTVGMAVAIITQLIVASLFGAESQMDAYVAGLQLPLFISTVLFGALSYVFVPIYAQQRSVDGDRAAWQMTSTLINLSGLFVAILTLVGIFFRRPLLTVLVPGLSSSSLDLAVHLALILWPMLFTGGIVSILLSINQAQEKFVWQAFVPLVGSLLTLAVVISFVKSLGIQSLALGTLVGSLAQLALLLPTVLGRERYILRTPLWSFSVKEIVKLLSPLVGSRLFSNASILLERYIASSLVVGSIARITYSKRVVLLLINLFSPAIATTIFPTMAYRAARNDTPALRQAFSMGTRYVWLLYAPVILIGFVLAKPFITLFFERGEFSPSDSRIVSELSRYYLVSMAALVLGDITSRTLYALKRTRIMAMLNVFSIFVYAGIALLLVPILGVYGLAVATAITDWTFYLVQCVLICQVTGRVIERDLLVGVGRISVAALLGGVAAAIVRSQMESGEFLCLVFSGLSGVFMYCVALILLRAPEFKSVFTIVLSRLYIKTHSA